MENKNTEPTTQSPTTNTNPSMQSQSSPVPPPPAPISVEKAADDLKVVTTTSEVVGGNTMIPLSNGGNTDVLITSPTTTIEVVEQGFSKVLEFLQDQKTPEPILDLFTNTANSAIQLSVSVARSAGTGGENPVVENKVDSEKQVLERSVAERDEIIKRMDSELKDVTNRLKGQFETLPVSDQVQGMTQLVERAMSKWDHGKTEVAKSLPPNHGIPLSLTELGLTTQLYCDTAQRYITSLKASKPNTLDSSPQMNGYHNGMNGTTEPPPRVQRSIIKSAHLQQQYQQQQQFKVPPSGSNVLNVPASENRKRKITKASELTQTKQQKLDPIEQRLMSRNL